MLIPFTLSFAQDSDPGGFTTQTNTAPAATNAPPGPTLPPLPVERGPNSALYLTVLAKTNLSGEVSYFTNYHTRLETGLNRRRGGQWVPASDQIQILENGGASCTNTEHSLYLPGSLYSDALQCVTPDGRTLTSRPLGLSYAAGDQNIFVAEIRDGPTGQLLPSGNVAIWTNALEGLNCHVVVTSKKSGMESDLLFTENNLPDPASVGITSAPVVVQWWTEFLNTPAPQITRRTLPDGTTDDELDWGSFQMTEGQGFFVGDPGSANPGGANPGSANPGSAGVSPASSRVRVRKQWITTAARY